MRIKILSVIAAAALLGACSTDPDTASSVAGSGASSTASTSGSGSASSSTGSSVTTGVSSAETKTVGPEAGSQEDLAINVGDRVFFGFDKFDLDAEARTVMERQAFWMRRNPSVTVTIEGHADERGTREYNIALGERRASAVRDYLVTLGIDGSRVQTISYGKERPVDGRHDEEAWAKNRRGVTRVN